MLQQIVISFIILIVKNSAAPTYFDNNVYAIEGILQKSAKTVFQNRTQRLYDGGFPAKITGPEVGVNAAVGVNNISIGFRATAGEIEARVGKAFGVGWKLGLSADSNFELGKNGLKLHVLGTGGSITTQKGFELCLLGSCFNIG